jgi:hypothetical protein
MDEALDSRRACEELSSGCSNRPGRNANLSPLAKISVE